MSRKPTLDRMQGIGAGGKLSPGGVWTVAHLAEIKTLLSGQSLPPGGALTLDGSRLEALDTSAAWLLVSYVRAGGITPAAVTPEHFNPNHAKILELAGGLEHPPSPPCDICGPVRGFFVQTGGAAHGIFSGLHTLIAFFGQLCACLLHTLLRPHRLRLRSTVYHLNEICLRGIPIVCLMAFLLSIVMGYQGAHQLSKFGAKIFTIDLVAISLLREMGVVITSILVAGRSGSAFAAQIGVMQVNDEVDAMRTIGLDPFEMLVLPRVIAIMIALPMLTVLADIAGLMGAYVVSSSIVDISFLQFQHRLNAAVSVNTFLIGVLKAPVFALLIGMVGCMQGMQVKNSAAEVGSRTTAAVVQAIFLVILFDAMFSILLTMAGI